MLLQLPPLSQVPRPHRVVQPSCPQLGAVRRDVDAAGAVGVALELPDQGLVVEIPHCDVPVAAAAEAHLAVRADGQGVAGRGRAGHFSFDSRSWRRQVPDRNCACFSSHHQGSAVRQELDAADVVVPGEAVKLGDGCFPPRLADVPDLHTALTTGVHILGWVRHGDSADHVPMGKSVDLSYVSRNARTDEGVCRKWHRSCLSLRVYVERVGPETVKVSRLSLPLL